MTIEIIGGIVVLALMSAIGWLSFKYGQVKERQKTNESKADDMARDAESAAKPFVPDPVSDIRRMCGKD